MSVNQAEGPAVGGKQRPVLSQSDSHHSGHGLHIRERDNLHADGRPVEQKIDLLHWDLARSH